MRALPPGRERIHAASSTPSPLGNWNRAVPWQDDTTPPAMALVTHSATARVWGVSSPSNSVPSTIPSGISRRLAKASLAAVKRFVRRSRMA